MCFLPSPFSSVLSCLVLLFLHRYVANNDLTNLNTLAINSPVSVLFVLQLSIVSLLEGKRLPFFFIGRQNSNLSCNSLTVLPPVNSLSTSTSYLSLFASNNRLRSLSAEAINVLAKGARNLFVHFYASFVITCLLHYFSLTEICLTRSCLISQKYSPAYILL